MRHWGWAMALIVSLRVGGSSCLCLSGWLGMRSMTASCTLRLARKRLMMCSDQRARKEALSERRLCPSELRKWVLTWWVSPYNAVASTVCEIKTLRVSNTWWFHHLFCISMSLRSTVIQARPDGSCLFASGSPTDTVGSQSFQTFSTCPIAFWWRSGRCRQCYTDFLLQCAGDIEADHTYSGIVMDSADRNRETPHLGDWWGDLTTTTTSVSKCSFLYGTGRLCKMTLIGDSLLC